MTEKDDKKTKKEDDQKFENILHDGHIMVWFICSNLDEFGGCSIEQIGSLMEPGEDGRTAIGKNTEMISPNNGKVVPDSIFELKLSDSDDGIAHRHRGSEGYESGSSSR